MNKGFKLFTVFTLAIVLSIVAAGAVFFGSSGIQTALVRLFLPEGMSVEKVHVGFREINLEEGVFSNDQVQVQVKRIHGDFSLFRTLFRRHLQLGELNVSDLRIDLGKWEPSETPLVPDEEIAPEEFEMPWESIADFKGIFHPDFAWPPVALESLAVNGALILPGGQRQLVMRLEGERLRTDVAPTIQLVLDYSDSNEDALVSRGSVKQELLLSFSPQGVLNGLRLDTLAEADLVLEEIRENHALAMLVDLRRTEDAKGEDYRFSLTLSPDDPDPLEVVSGQTFYAYDEKVFTGDWALHADTRAVPSLFEPFLNGAWAILQADGSFNVNPAEENVWWRGQGEVRAENLDLSQEENLLLQLTARGSVTDLDAEPYLDLDFEWTVNLADLMAKPAFKPFRNLSEGSLTGAAKASGVMSRMDGDLGLSLTDLVLAGDGRTISSLSLQADALVEEMSHFRLVGPLTVQADGEITDLNLDFGLWLDEELSQFKLNGQGDKVVVEHFQTLAEAFQNPDFVAPEQDDPEVAPEDDSDLTSEPDSVPVWHGIAGDANLEIGELIIAGEYNLQDMVVQAEIEDNSARLEQFTAIIGASAANAKGELVFRPDQPGKPYLLKADFSFLDFDIGAYLREAKPDTEPVISAVISVSGEAFSEASKLNLLAESLTGDFSVTADDGVFRALRRGAVSGTIGIASTLGGLAGRLTGQQDVEAVSQLVSYFNAVEFDEFLLQAGLKTDFTIELKRFFLRNPDLLIDGHGQVSYREGREWYQQPIAVTLDMGARPPLSRLFDELNLLREEPGDDGYRFLTRPVELRGNVGEPDPRPMWEVILEAAVRKLLNHREGEERERRDSPLDELRGIFGL